MDEDKAQPRGEKSEKRDLMLRLFSFVICVFLYVRDKEPRVRVYECVCDLSPLRLSIMG